MNAGQSAGAAPRRALIMAGGGLKVAFQAGALQVWLDEARDLEGRPLEFMHADGASGGVFNLAMWCQGMSGHRIADNWRRFSPVLQGLSVNWRGLVRGRSLLTMDRFRRRVLREAWGLDWPRIRATDRSATFNLYNVTDNRLTVLRPREMHEDLLVAAGSLPIWYPPVQRLGKTYIDGVFVTDANLDAAIEAGADELWVIWTVSRNRSGPFREGPVGSYFQMIEASANGQFQQAADRIERSNRALAEGGPAQYDRPVRLRVLAADVSLHYLLDFTRAGFVRAVDQGVAEARRWIQEQADVQLGAPAAGAGAVPAGATTEAPAERRRFWFRERMAGPVAFGVPDSAIAAQLGDARGDELALNLRVEVPDLDAFLSSAGHRAQVFGTIDCELLGGRLPITAGELAILPDDGDRRDSVMQYRLEFRDATGRPLRLHGYKTAHDDPGFDLWRDTTTVDLFVVRDEARDEGPRGPDAWAGAAIGMAWDPAVRQALRESAVLTGRLRLSPLAFLRQLTTLRADGPGSGPGGVRAAARFSTFFLSRLADAYLGPPQARQVEPAGRP